MAEQQRILTVFNDFMIAQKLMLLGQADARMPQLANEPANREELQHMIREMAEANVNKAALTGIVNNFGTQYCKFVTDRDAVERQRQINDIERARVSGHQFLPIHIQRHLRICQATAIIALGCTFGACMSFWSGAKALEQSITACRTAGLQCMVMGILMFFAIAARLSSRFACARYRMPSEAYGRDRMYVSRVWDWCMIAVFCLIVSFGAWMWSRGNHKFVHHHAPPQVYVTKTRDATPTPTPTAMGTPTTAFVEAIVTKISSTAVATAKGFFPFRPP
ncbi:hypothetical protein ABW21_db0207879 [Orbilia brochopaga]|nr:hypothetical protein ABW21_db0207879 [Drechslerella brochopaga]